MEVARAEDEAVEALVVFGMVGLFMFDELDELEVTENSKNFK